MRPPCCDVSDVISALFHEGALKRGQPQTTHDLKQSGRVGHGRKQSGKVGHGRRHFGRVVDSRKQTGRVGHGRRITDARNLLHDMKPTVDSTDVSYKSDGLHAVFFSSSSSSSTTTAYFNLETEAPTNFVSCTFLNLQSLFHW